MGWVLFATAFLFGLLVGSFVNVVIHRGPAMWRLVSDDHQPRGDLIAPRSYCPNCRKQIPIADLIPVVSYLALRGRCRACAAPIPIRYLIVEFAGGLAAVLTFVAFGLSWSALLAFVFLLSLIALAAIDAETGYLPDAITLPLIVVGVAANGFGIFATLQDALLGAAAGYIAFAFIAFLYRRLRGREGLGAGDAKLLAAIGAWGGWMLLPLVIFVASASALLFVALARGRRLSADQSIPFGPALCAAGAIALLAAGSGALPLYPP